MLKCRGTLQFSLIRMQRITVLFWRRCDMLCTSGLWMTSSLHIMVRNRRLNRGQHGFDSARWMLKLTHRGAAPDGGRSLISTNSLLSHAQPFNGPFLRDYPGEPVPERKNQSGFYWSKRQRVAVASTGTYASLHLAPGRQPRQHPTTQFFTGRMPFLPPNQQRQSTEGTLLSL